MVEEDGIIINVAEQQLLDNRIDILTVDDLRRKGTNWTKIAAYFHVGRRSLYRWRERNNHIDPLEPLTNEQLDGRIQAYTDGNKDRAMLRTCVLTDGYGAFRARVRESIHRVDHDEVEQRKYKAIKRRVYKVAGPHHLWHLDGNHKLFAYHLVIHGGGIDGFSR